jgi:RES domain-containing protein
VDPIRTRWSGVAAVAVEGRNAWDVRSLISTDENRWSRRGEPTIYLAGDVAMALAEFARHLSPDRRDPVGLVWEVDVRLAAVVDLRRQDVRHELGLPETVTWMTDADRCREVGSSLRARGAEALLVPSAAFLDRPERGNLVLFGERLDGRLDMVVREPRPRAAIRPL